MSENTGERFSKELCAQKAEECRKLAKQAIIESHRVMFEHTAETWERIAKGLKWPTWGTRSNFRTSAYVCLKAAMPRRGRDVQREVSQCDVSRHPVSRDTPALPWLCQRRFAFQAL